MPKSSKTEKNLWQSLKKHLPKKTHCQRIENRVAEGMPDVYMCIDGAPVWVELKIIKRNGITLQPSQIAWHLSHSRCGGVSFFLASPSFEPDVFLFESGKALEIQGATPDDLRTLALWTGDMRSAPATLRLLVIEQLRSTLRPATCA